MQPGTMYGTRSQTVIVVWRDGRVEQRERYVESIANDNGQSGQQQPRRQSQQSELDDMAVANGSWIWKEVEHSFYL
jgi:hypothetical protein